MKFGSAKTMSKFASMNVPFIASLWLPAYHATHSDSESFYLSEPFVYVVVIITSMMNGFAMGMTQPASGNYVAECSSEKTKGFYFAFFQSFYMGS